MKKVLALALALILLACGIAALAEEDDTYFPKSEEYVGVWYVDDYILEIDHVDEESDLFNCIVTQYTDDYHAVRWIYDACSYDDVGQALTCVEIGSKFEVTYDEIGELVSSEPVHFTDGAAAFHINEDGTLTWTDFKETPGENETVFERTDGYMVAYDDSLEGTWICDRATIIIEDLDDIIYCTVLWGSSDSEVSEWYYEDCAYEIEGIRLITQANGIRTNLTYDDEGEVTESEQIYDDGVAVFELNDDGLLTWEDRVENAGEGMQFERVDDYENAIPDDVISEGFVKVVLGMEQGTAGASLKQAQAACEVLQFIAEQDLTGMDVEDVSISVLMALVECSEEELAVFGENFPIVSTLIDSCFEDWEANRPVFDDAGVADTMEALIADETARQNWEMLRDCTQDIVEIMIEP